MITLQDIRAAIIWLLRQYTKVEHIHGEEIRQREFPLLYVELIPAEVRTAAAGQHTEKNILVDLLYMEETYTSNEKNYQMLEQLDSIIRPVLQIKDRSITIETAQMEITDGVAHYKFYLNFTDQTGHREEPEPFMEHMQLTIKDEEDRNGITRNQNIVPAQS